MRKRLCGWDGPSEGKPPSMLLGQRSSGVLLHLTSLPGGRLGEEAFRFIDWLEAAGQSWWQVLPLGPPDSAGSPYRARSAFACWSGFLAEPEAVVSREEVERYVAEHAFWVGPWAAFAGADAIADQVRFEREWTALRRYAAERNVRLIGDLPLYIAPDGADLAAWPELFLDGLVAGVPPDDWSASGQLWGNPLYDWELQRRTRYRWWIERFRRTFELVEATRLDHFRGFVAYWAVDDHHKTARKGVWRRGPGRRLFEAVHSALGDLTLVAEDLGVITGPVETLRDELGLPGMTVLHFAFTDAMKNPHQLVDHENRVVYTGTHDNDTTVGWWHTASSATRDNLDAALARAGIDEAEPHWKLIRLAYASRARIALVPAQDLLGLGSEARLNVPGKAEGNWRWQLKQDQLTPELAAELRELATDAGRAPAQKKR
jgi:4-alpha-glucanotransferase